MFPQATGNETNIKLPFLFIFYSLAAMIASQILLLMNADTISSGIFRVPGIWSAAHLFILGWALMMAMGAMYQLVPVAFLTPVWSEKLGFFQFAVTAIGITWFALALYIAPYSALFPGFVNIAWNRFVCLSNGHDSKKTGTAKHHDSFCWNGIIMLIPDHFIRYHYGNKHENRICFRFLHGHF